MAETVITSAEPNTNPDGLLDHPAPSDNGSLFHSKLEFHIAKKPFTGFSNGGGDFRLETLNPSSDSHSPRLGSNQGSGSLAPGGMKPDTSEILENGLDPEFSFGITFRRIGAGLENLGNTCFLNSVLQCLTYTEPLAAYLQSGRHQNSCRTAGFCALCAIQKHVSRALQSTGRILAPKDLVSNLRCISRSFRNSRQEDAHEYMVNLLESMHKCCLPSGVPSESPSAYEKSLVHKIFGGRIRSQVKCMQCSFCSNKFDPFVDLSLEIVNADSLYKALALFTAKEQLDGGEKQYQCQQCKQKVKALKQLTVHKAPYVLTIHLKRFGPHALGQKIDKKVQFGRTLDLRSFVTGPYGGDLKYTLYGVLVHAGWSTHSGHYYCFVRTSSGMWYSLDDNQVVQVNERIVLEQKAYMLFYVRDRRNVAQKKPIDVVQKENMVIHAMGNQTHSNSNQGLNETIQSGPSDKKDHVKGLSFPTLNGEEGLPQSSPSIGGSNDILKLDNSTIMKTTAKIIDFQQEESYKKDPSDSLSISPKCNGTQRSAEDLCIAEKTCQMIVKEASSKDPDRKASERNDSVRSLTRTGDEDCQIRGLSNGSAVGDSSSEKAGDIGQRTGKNELVDLSQSVLQTKARDRKYHKELKKKLHKCRVASIHLGPNILLGASLGPRRKKKKHKKSKHQTLKIKNLSEEHFLNRVSLSTDLRPSTSEINRTVSLNDSAYSTRKKTKSGLDEKYNSAAIKNGTTSNVDSLMGVINEEFRERVDPNRAVLANDKPPQKCSDSVSAGNQMDDRGTNSPDDRRRDSVQNGFMNMLTRGLEETIVARWDGTEMPPSQARDSGFGSFSIGYIGDERDEEYDCGKRKKVRSSKNSFGGPNPFQEIARKKAKMDQSSSGDRPFRI